MERTSPTAIYAFVFAVVAGVLFATNHIIGGCILTVAAIAALWAWRNRDDDERGIY